MLTSPDRWDKEFVVIDVSRPYGLMGKFVSNLPKGLKPNSPQELYDNAYNKSGYKMSPSWVIAKFWSSDDAVEFYRWTRDATDGRTVISKDEYEGLLKAKEAVLSNEFTYPYFFNTYIHTELYHQLPIYFEYKDVQAKALLDGVLVDHKAKTIQPFDLKTTSKSVYKFQESFIAYGYYRQCAFYEFALFSKDSPLRHLIDDGYEVLDFIFIVVESKSSSMHPAIIYRTTPNDRLCGLQGGFINNKFHKGIDQLLDDYQWHTENDFWEMPVDLVKSNGEINLDIFDYGSI